jgi:hypothetical protein
MPTGKYCGYTGDTLVHLAYGERKYMRDLAVGDLIKINVNEGDFASVTHVFQFKFDGFISLVAPGITTTRYTTYDDLVTGLDTTPEQQNKPTLYYKGTLYNFMIDDCGNASSVIMGTNPSSGPGMLAFNSPRNIHDSASTIDTFIRELNGVWCDPPGVVSKRIGHAERMAMAAATATH